jgi:DNA-binding NarL/FixJ family response regulator
MRLSGTRVNLVVGTDVEMDTSALSQSGEFAVVRSNATGVELFLQCEMLSPCIVIANEEALTSVKPDELPAAVGFGLPVQALVISNSSETQLCSQFLRYRCSGFVRPATSSAVLLKAVRAIASGELWLTRRVLSMAIRELAPGAATRRLTARQSEVLQMVEQGLTNRQIAEALGISRETVRLHLRTLNSKVGCDTRKRGPVRANWSAGPQSSNILSDRV